MSSDHRSDLVSARGTAKGLSICVRTDAARDVVLGALKEFVSSRVSFLSGNEISVEWRGAREEQLAQSVLRLLEDDFGIVAEEQEERDSNTPPFQRKRLSLAVPVQEDSEVGRENMTSDDGEIRVRGGVSSGEEAEPSLFDGLGSSREYDDEKSATKGSRRRLSESGVVSKDFRGVLDPAELWDDPDARVVYETLRSGQRLESEHTVVVVGDVNSGAEVVSGGDVIVLGRLRGVAHAGAFEESGGRRFIFALDLDPTQLRIGSVISRGDESRKTHNRREHRPEVARVDTDRIVVEEYSPRPRFQRGVGNL